MPNIRELNVGPLGLRPSEVGVEATAGAARRISGLFNQTAEALTGTGRRVGSAINEAVDVAVAHETHEQTTAGSLRSAQLALDIDTKWNDTFKGALADPSNPQSGAVDKKFREEQLEPALDKFREGFTTEKSQAWADHFVNQFRESMFRQTAGDMSRLAGERVRSETTGTVNTWTNTVYSNPAMLGTGLDMLDHSIGGIVGSSPKLSAADASKVSTEVTDKGRRELIHAAISGTIAKGGDWQAIANDPKNAPYVNRPELETFAKAAKGQARADILQQKQLEDYQHTQQVRDGADKLGKAFTDNVTYDDQMRPIVKPGLTKTALDIARSNPTAADHARTLINWGEAQLRERKETVQTDPATKKSLYDGLFSTDNPTTEVALMKAQIAGKLSNQDFSQLHQLQKTLEEKPLKGPLYQGTMEAVKGMLGTSVMPDGHERYGNFVQTFIPAYLALDAKDQAAALNLKDPSSLISKSMEGIKPTPAQLMVGHALRNTGVSPEMMQSLTVTPPAGPGETPRPGAKPRPVNVKTPEEATKLNPGTRYMRPGDDKVYVR